MVSGCAAASWQNATASVNTSIFSFNLNLKLVFAKQDIVHHLQRWAKNRSVIFSD